MKTNQVAILGKVSALTLVVQSKDALKAVGLLTVNIALYRHGNSLFKEKNYENLQ